MDSSKRSFYPSWHRRVPALRNVHAGHAACVRCKRQDHATKTCADNTQMVGSRTIGAGTRRLGVLRNRRRIAIRKRQVGAVCRERWADRRP